MKTIFNICAGCATIYLLGFGFTVVAFMGGSDGQDALSMHYRSTIASVIN